MKQEFTGIALTFILLLKPVSAQDLRQSTPESVGLSSATLGTATAALQDHIAAGNIAGVVAAVARHGQLVYLEALGQRELAPADLMTKDTLFRIYSMTRPITSVAAMILWEEGKFSLDDPITQYLPQFSKQRVFINPERPDPTQTKPRLREITVRHLLTHTSGLGGRNSPIYRAEQVRLRSISLSQMVDNAARVPLFEDPGTRFRYGISTTILGRLIEIWSGQPFEEFLANRLLVPLGMTDTVFWVTDQQASRLSTVYRPNEETGTGLSPYMIETVPFTERPALIEGGVGLLSSVMDYLRFAQMLLNRGTLNEAQVLRPDTVDLMTSNHVPERLLPLSRTGYMAASGWGLGFNIVLEPSGYPFPVSNNEYWWDGSSGTRFSVDPKLGLVTVIMAAVSPSRGGGFRETFKSLVHKALNDTP